MIELITGLPGHGKTLYTLFKVEQLRKQSGRKVYHNGINGLTLDWEKIDPKDWETLPPNSILVIDEAQFVFPVRGRGQPPEHIERLAVHRHGGVDLFVVTQNPMLIDSFVRRLVDRHWHVVRKFGTSFATIHEFPNGVRESVDKSRSGSITHEWRYPAEVYGWYTSAEVHTVQRRVPLRIWFLLASPLILGALVWLVYSRITGDAHQSAPPAAVAALPPAAATPAAGGTRPPARAAAPSGPATTAEWLAQRTPRLAGLPHTAPLYDGRTQPVSVPYPAICIAMQSRCQCYTDQATPIGMDDASCRRFAAEGFFREFPRNPPAAPSSVPAGV